jgi:similar to stage IV sporulation protein
MLEKLRAFWRGRLLITVRGKNAAVFINEALREGIVFFQTQRSETGLRAQVRLEDFRRLRRAARASQMRVRISARYGWPFILARWWRRKGLIAGAVMIAAIVIMLSQMILVISVQGNKSIQTPVIMETAETLGLRTFIWQKNVDIPRISAGLRDAIPDIAWVGIERKGISINISIVEKVRPQIPAAAGNLVAAKTGLIQEIMVIQGTSLVHEGEIVRQGQELIVRGEAEAAKGFVRGRVWYSTEAVVPLHEDRLEDTGRIIKGWGIKFKSRVIMVTNPESPFEQARKEEDIHTLFVWRNWSFPVEVIYINYHELQNTHRERTAAEARQEAERMAKAEVYAQLMPGVAVTEEKVRILTGSPGTEKIRVELETYEDLAVYADS